MFDGEAASLQALLQTNTVHVPKPIKVHTSIMARVLGAAGMAEHQQCEEQIMNLQAIHAHWMANHTKFLPVFHIGL